MDNVHSSRCLPTNFDVTAAFRRFWPIGNHLLKKGKEGANMLIFLHSHLGYIARLMQQGGFSMHHILFLSGKSGAGKSSLLQELSGEIFYDRSFKTKMDATQSFIEGRIKEMRDSLFLVDDVHPSPTRNMGDNLMYELYTAISNQGLHPYFGFFHSLRNNHPALASDLLEEWRPVLIDSLVLSLIHHREIVSEHFYHWEKSDGIFLNPEGRKIFLQAYEKKMRTMNQYITGKHSYRRSLDYQVEQYSQALMQENSSLYEPIWIR